MNNEEWLQWRKGGIGSSDAPIIMNASPWRTPRQLWEDKVYGNSVQLETSSMTRGKELESVARHWFEESMNVTVFPKNKVHPSSDWLRASLDGMNLEETIMVEIKCPNKDDHAVAVNKMVPDKYWPQVQHQLLVTGLDGMYYCSFDGSKGAIVEVARDNAYIEAMLKEEQKFWDKVLSKEAPPLTDRDFITMEQNEEWRLLAARWLEASEHLDSVEAKEKEIRRLMISLSNDRNAIGHGVKVSRSDCDGAIDYKLAFEDYIDRLKSFYPDLCLPFLDLSTYRKKSFTKWTFRAT